MTHMSPHMTKADDYFPPLTRPEAAVMLTLFGRKALAHAIHVTESRTDSAPRSMNRKFFSFLPKGERRVIKSAAELIDLLAGEVDEFREKAGKKAASPVEADVSNALSGLTKRGLVSRALGRYCFAERGPGLRGNITRFYLMNTAMLLSAPVFLSLMFLLLNAPSGVVGLVGGGLGYAFLEMIPSTRGAFVLNAYMQFRDPESEGLSTD